MIVTFYSFKGGVGRSFSLVEVALQLAGRGASVVVWDLDLEAPGLQQIPGLHPIKDALVTGTLDLLLEFQQRNYTFPATERLRESLVDFPLPPQMAKAGGRLSFLLPACLDDSYAAKYSQIDWEILFRTDGAGAAFFHKVAAVLLRDLEFQYLLIDSRTGFTDLGAVCILQLPDLVVLVFNLNEQNLEGTKRAYQAVSRAPARSSEEIPVLLVANMIPEEPADLREKKLAELSKKKLTKPHCVIPLRPELLLTDQIPSLSPDLQLLSQKLGEIVEKIEDRHRFIAAGLERGDRENLARAFARGDRQGIDDALTFEEKVAELFSLLGHSVTPRHRSGELEFDLRLDLTAGAFIVQALVLCQSAGRPLGSQQVKDFAERVQKARASENPRYEAMLVASSGFSAAAREMADLLGVQLQSYEQLLLSVVDLDPLLDQAILEFQGSALERLYVDLDALQESELRPGRQAEPKNATTVVHRWLQHKGAGPFLLLGEAGSGKTSFCKRLASELAQQVRSELSEGKIRSRIPVHINLREAGEADTIEDLLLKHFQHVSRKPVHLQAPLRINREGYLLLLLDGFDEIPGKSEPGYYVERLRQLLRVAEGKAKILLTCRPHFFRDRQAVTTRTSTPLYKEVRDRPGVEVAYLLDLTEERIKDYLRKALPPPVDWDETYQKLRQTLDLADLAARPFFLDLVVRALPVLSRRDGEITPTYLYETYCQSWFNQTDFLLTLDPQRRAVLVEHLARLIWSSPEGRVHYEVLAEKALELFRERRLPFFDKDRVDSEIRTAPFLRRDAEGYYSFIHRSFLEFFIARGLREGLAADDASCLDLRRITREVAFFLESWSGAATIEPIATAVLAQSYRSLRSENALLLLYFRARATLGPLVGPGSELLSPAQLSSLTEAFVRLRPEEIHLENADLEGAALPGIDLSHAHLEGARLVRTDLRQAVLDEAFLQKAALSFADLRDSHAEGADFTGALVDHVDGRRAFLQRALFRQADLSFARFTQATLRHADFEEARLTGAGFLQANMSPQELPSDPSLGQILGQPELRPQLGASAPVTDLSWSPQGHCLAVIVRETAVVLWDVGSQTCLLVLERPGDRFLAVAWETQGQRLAVASRSTTAARSAIQLWDSFSGRLEGLIDIPEPAGCLAWSPDGKLLAYAPLKSNAIHLLHFEAERHTTEILPEEHGEHILALAWNPGGDLLASASQGNLRFWRPQGGSANPLRPLPSIPLALHWSLDGSLTVALRDGGAFLPESSEFSTAVHLLPASNLLSPYDSPGLRTADAFPRIRWSPDGDQVATAVGGGPAEVRRISDRSRARRLEVISTIPVSTFFWEPAGRHVTVGLDQGLGLCRWDLEEGSPFPWSAEGTGTALAFGWHERELCVVGLLDDLSCLLIADHGEVSVRQSVLPGGKAIAAGVSPDGRRLAAVLNDGESVIAWDLGPAPNLRRLSLPGGIHILRIAFSPRGEFLAAVGEDGKVRIWSCDDSGTASMLEGNEGESRAVAWSPEGQSLATAAADGSVRIWDTESRRLLKVLSGARMPALALAWSPAGNLLASGSSDQTVQVWDWDSERRNASLRRSFAIQGLPSGLAWDPEGARLAIALETGIHVWDLNASRLCGSLYSLPTGPLAVTRDGYVSGAPEALNAVRFGDRWALYDLKDVPDRFWPSKVAEALRPAAATDPSVAG